MRHVMRWNELPPADSAAADTAQADLRRATTRADHRNAAARLARTRGIHIAGAADMRVVRAAMAALGMGPPPDADPSAYGLPSRALASSAGPRAARAVQAALAPTAARPGPDADARERPPLGERDAGHAVAGRDSGGIPLRTLTIRGLTWNVDARTCRHALRIWRNALYDWQPHLDLLLDASGLTTERRLAAWLTWIGYLNAAASHGGFYAEGVTHPINRAPGAHPCPRAASAERGAAGPGPWLRGG